MNEHLRFSQTKRLELVQKALQANRMGAHVVQTAAEVPALLQSMLQEGETVSFGGSVTLEECGAFKLLRSGRYNLLDREAPGADKPAIFRQSFYADTYLASANAITQSGHIYEIDGNGNRVAALAYGPARVILVAGRNKIVADIEAARQRNVLISGPANAHRVGAKTPCITTGLCADCKSPGRICCTELIIKQQQIQGRIQVILVNEELGF
ncbi:MAG: lactate utilization protein [Oscillospiraceae bacterium]